MAKFQIEYCIHVGDKVAFNYNGVKKRTKLAMYTIN